MTPKKLNVQKAILSATQFKKLKIHMRLVEWHEMPRDEVAKTKVLQGDIVFFQ